MSHQPRCGPQFYQSPQQHPKGPFSKLALSGGSRFPALSGGEEANPGCVQEKRFDSRTSPPAFRGLWPVDGRHAWHPLDLLLEAVQSS